MTKINLRRLNVIAKFTFKHNIKKSSYWSGLLWPVSVLVMILAFGISPDVNTKNLVFSNFPRTLSIGMGVFVLLFSLLLIPITGNEIENDRSSKINEFLWVISRSEDQFSGRLLGVFYLLIASLGLYIIGFSFFMTTNELLSSLMTASYSYFVNWHTFLLILLMLQIFGWILLLTAHISIYIKNHSHLLQALTPVYVYIMISIFLTFVTLGHFSSSKLLTALIFPVWSQIISSQLVFYHRDDTFFLFISTGLQMLLLVGYFWIVKQKYQKAAIMD
ncbi:hypothetical protein [Pediococcus ethanolidurans]|nr:hypothetical protein [Pediococcus ethanolidurans]SER92327.1 hypothetical protein SAMN04487973_12812 [Pediococcus ethanolidurans]